MPRALLPILAITFVDILGFTLLIPLLPFYATTLGASPVVVGAIYATVAVCSLLSSPLWGRLSDRIGRRGVLLAAQVAALIGFVLLASSNTLWMIFVARAIEGLGGGGLGITQAYVTDVTAPEQRARAFGLVGATFGLGFLIGPATAGLLVRFGYHVPFAAAAGLELITVMLTLTLLPESRGAVTTLPPLREVKRSLTTAPLGRLVLTQFAFSIGFTSWIGGFALFAQRVLGFGPERTSQVYILFAVVGIVVQVALIGRLVAWLGEGRVALAGFACAILAYATVAFIDRAAFFYPFIVLWSISGSLIRPTLGSLIADAAPGDQRGTILSINDSLNNVAFIVGPLIATRVLMAAPHLTGIVPAFFSAVALALGLGLLMRAPRAEGRLAT
ncbi:MAG TPA: MFS transporter [Candidatus Sulfotelmatobacter sp.]|nr:MFS transporter [Candidatus Sulfotelmatobacter sp.]